MPSAELLTYKSLKEYKLASFDDSKVRVEAEIKKVVADFVELELSESFDLNRKRRLPYTDIILLLLSLIPITFLPTKPTLSRTNRD